MITLGIALLGSIFLSLGCLIAAIRSMGSLVTAYDRESRIVAVSGIAGGLIASAFFAWAAIRLLSVLEGIQDALGR